MAYIEQIEAATVATAKGEGVFKDVSAVHPQFRMARCARHHIFCVERPHALPIILAILHERMDVMAWLTSRLAS
jgi:plasmid stabilization system protein ParE